MTATAPTPTRGLPLQLGPEDPVEAAARLRTARRRATGLLAVVAVAFVASLFGPDTTLMGYVQAMLEAALVGGLADWFAVVALFRHPLGVPIPHTAVIPSSKDRLGRGLSTFVLDSFLEDAQIHERLTDDRLPLGVGEWLADPEQADRLAGGVAALAARLLDESDTERLRLLVTDNLRDRAADLPAGPLVGEALERAVKEGRHRGVVTALITAAEDAIDDNRLLLRRRLGEESPWWVPEGLDDAVYRKGEEIVTRFLHDLAQTPDHELRQAIDERLLAFAHALQHDPDTGARVSRALVRLVDDPALQTWITDTTDRLRTVAVQAAADDDDGGRARLAGLVAGAGERLKRDAALRAAVSTWLGRQSGRIAAAGKGELGQMIQQTIDSWDGEDVAGRLETWMGPDLQFVRINGTVVGGLVGLVLHALVELLG